MFIGWVLHELIFKYIELSKASREIMAKASDKNCLLFENGANISNGKLLAVNLAPDWTHCNDSGGFVWVLSYANSCKVQGFLVQKIKYPYKIRQSDIWNSCP